MDHEVLLTVDVPVVPKSLNRMSRGTHWKFAKEKARLQNQLYSAIYAARLPRGADHIYAEAVLRFQTARHRDEGNFRSVLEKALGDTLQLLWLPDDTPDHFEFGPLSFDDATGTPRTLLFLKARYA